MSQDLKIERLMYVITFVIMSFFRRSKIPDGAYLAAATCTCVEKCTQNEKKKPQNDTVTYMQVLKMARVQR